jgi:hypothetical protein
MSLLDTASLVVTPNGTKASKLYSVVPSDGSGDLSVTRATTATRVNSSGLIESVASNVPRLDYTNGTCPSILVEPQRTNLALYSEQFDNASWSKLNSSSTANQSISPNGNTTADIITDDSTNDRHLFFQTFTGDFSTSRTFSTYAKKNSLRYLVLSITAVNDSLSCYSAIFDLQTGTITATKNNGTATINASIQSAGNGWYKCIISGSLGTGLLSYFPLIATSNRATFTGDLVNNNIPIYSGSGQSLYIWGAQLEEGSYATSYIPTTSASVTRNADVISKTGISSLIGQTEGTMYAEIYANQAGGQQNWFEINDGSLDNWIFLGKEGNKIRGYIRTNSTNHFDNTSFSITNNAPMKVALAYKSGNYALYINGTQIASGTSSFTISNTISVAGFNYTISTGDTSSFKVTALWKTRLTNTQLAQLTTI